MLGRILSLTPFPFSTPTSLFCLTQSPPCLFVLITPPVFSHFKTWNQSSVSFFSPCAMTLMLLPHSQQFIFQCCFGISVILLLTCPVIEEWLSVEIYYLCSATLQNGVLSTGTSISLHKKIFYWMTVVDDCERLNKIFLNILKYLDWIYFFIPFWCCK